MRRFDWPWHYAVYVGVWAIANFLAGGWIYFYVRAAVDPNPHTWVNKSHSGFKAFQICMFIYGTLVSVVNTCITYVLFSTDLDRGYKPLVQRYIRMPRIILYIAIFPVAAFFCIMPAFGGLIVLAIAQNAAWNHRCDPYPMYVILDGRSVKNPSYTPNVARFYQQGSSQSLFTYDVNSNSNADFWTFQLREFDTAQSLIPLNLYPTLQDVQYDFINDTITGNCTVPAAPGSSITNSTSCTSGTFNPNNWLSFNLTSSIPLNDTTVPAPSTTTFLQAVDKQWAFTNDAPSLILDTVNPATSALQQAVLQTAVTKRGDCTQLKVCIAGISGRESSLVGAEVMAPLGLILIRQADYATECTTPKKGKYS